MNEKYPRFTENDLDQFFKNAIVEEKIYYCTIEDRLNKLLNESYQDILKDFKAFYHRSKYKNLNKDEFLQTTFNFVEKYKDEIFRTEYGREWLLYMKDDTSLMILAATCFLNYKYDFIKNKLLSDF